MSTRPRLKADIEHDCATDARSCKGCTEYDTCDMCDRPVCKYVSITVHPLVDSEVVCRPCARELQEMGFFFGSLKEGAIFHTEEAYKEWLKEVS